MGEKKRIRRIKITDWNTKLNGHLDLGVERRNFDCTSFKILIKKYFFEYNLGIAHALLHNSINTRNV